MPTYKDKTPEGEEFLEKVRNRFKYCLEAWRDIRDQHDLDMRFLSGDAWDPKEISRRKAKNLPYISVDMLSQYMNQLVNDVRQNKRAVNVLPKGSGANDKTAGLRADWVRAIEYISQAQTAYTTAFEGAAGGSYGFWKLETYYEGETFDLSVKIVPITNANTIIYDPDCKLYDCSDAEDCFEINFMSEECFKREYPGAEIKSFSDDVQKVAPEWVKPKQIQVAGYWKVEHEIIQLHQVELPDGGGLKVMREKHLPENFDRGRIVRSRDFDDRRIVQYIVNGVEVLKKEDPRDGKGWPGKWIPVIGVFGKEMFVDEGSGSVRKLLSLIRLARDPQRVVNYLASQEMMEAKLTPKTAYIGPLGMFSANKEVWENINEDPSAFAEYNLVEGAQGAKPERVPFVPNFQQYEAAMQAWERRIMGAMGISPLPSAAQRQNEKSGVALEKIRGERAQGSFHFIDNFDRSIVFCGRQLDDLFARIHEGPARDIPGRKEDGTHYVARINDPKHPRNKEYDGDHDVTITTGPSYESQREEAASFADTLAQVPGVFPLIGDLIVRLRNIGPIGEQIAERLTPPQFAGKEGAEDLPPTAKAVIAQAQQQVEQMRAVIQQLQQEKAAKMVETQSREKIAAIQAQGRHVDTALQEQTKLIVAQASLQRDQAETILTSEYARIQAILDGMQAHTEIAHQGEQDRATAALEHQHALEQGQQAADLAPPPETAQNGTGS